MREKRLAMKPGFSLIELIITIAILTVFVGGAALSIGLLRSADTKGLATSIDSSLTDLKSLTESHAGPYYLHIYKKDGKGFYANFSASEAFNPTSADLSTDKRLGSEALIVKAEGYGVTTTAEDGTTTTVEATEPLVIENNKYTTVRIQKKDGGFFKDSPKSITVCNGDDTPEYVVSLVKETGLHYMHQP